MAVLEKSSAEIPQEPDVTCMLMNGAVVVQMLKPRMTKTFDEYAQPVFIPYLEIQLRNVSGFDLVWYRNISDSLKGFVRTKRGKGIRRRVSVVDKVTYCAFYD